ncbi:hypothetical protein ACWE42_15465 [Sutcliffiella cohnii]
MGRLAKMKKIITFLVLVSLLISVGPAYADDSGKVNSLSEEEIDAILIKEVGMPNDRVKQLNPLYKEELVEAYFNSDETLKFDRTEVTDYGYNEEGELIELPKDSDELSVMGVIPRTQLSLWFDVYDVYSSTHGNFKRFYGNFEWKVEKVNIRNDRLGIALPSGWQIIGGSADCRVNKYYAGKWNYDSNCGGRTMNASIYGYSWDVGYGTTTIAYKRNGWVKLDAKKTSSSAMNRAAGEYAHDTTSNRSTSISVQWGVASISHTVSGSGSIDTAGFDW